jgi:hypothetical protein
MIMFNLFLLTGAIALLILSMIYPFLPGNYDALAGGISNMAQAVGIVGLPLVPLGLLWLIVELWRLWRRRRKLPVRGSGFYFAIVTVVVATLVSIALAVVGVFSAGLSLGVFALTAWLMALSRLIPFIRALRQAPLQRFNVAPLYLIVLPLSALLIPLNFATPITSMSRERAIAMSAEIIDALENYHRLHGVYPNTLVATWPDYSPQVVGIEHYHYVQQGEAYNLIFQQPRFLLDDFGAREFVVFNPLDEHMIISHASWILLIDPSVLRRSQGWYTSRRIAVPHWKYFLFD